MKQETGGTTEGAELVANTESGGLFSEGTESHSGAVAEQAPKMFTQSADIVRYYAKWAAGVGIVPLPLVDMAAVLAVQMTMISKLAAFYGIPYAEQRTKATIASLIGGFNSGYFGAGALKWIPSFWFVSLVVMPTINAATTYAVGKVFIQHFESGGTFLDFEPARVRAYFEDQYRVGKLAVRNTD